MQSSSSSSPNVSVPMQIKPSKAKLMRGTMTNAERCNQKRVILGANNRGDISPSPKPVEVRRVKKTLEGIPQERLDVDSFWKRMRPTDPKSMGILPNASTKAKTAFSFEPASSPSLSTAPKRALPPVKTPAAIEDNPLSHTINGPVFSEPLYPMTRFGKTVFPSTKSLIDPPEDTALFAPSALRFRTGVLDKVDFSDDIALQRARTEFRLARRREHEKRVIAAYEHEKQMKELMQRNRALNFAYQRLNYFERVAQVESQRDKSTGAQSIEGGHA